MLTSKPERRYNVEGFLTLVILIEIMVPLETEPLFAKAFVILTESKAPLVLVSRIILQEGTLGENVSQLVVKDEPTIDSSEDAPRLFKVHFGNRISIYPS